MYGNYSKYKNKRIYLKHVMDCNKLFFAINHIDPVR